MRDIVAAGQQLATIRRRLGLNCIELGRAVGVAPGYLNKIELGQWAPLRGSAKLRSLVQCLLDRGVAMAEVWRFLLLIDLRPPQVLEALRCSNESGLEDADPSLRRALIALSKREPATQREAVEILREALQSRRLLALVGLEESA